MINKFLLFILIISFAYAHAQLATDSLLIDSHYRSFHFNTPIAIKANASLIFILHGSGGKGEDMVRGAAKLQAISANENVLLVYPDGYKNYWNECRKASTALANLENIDEQAFFKNMIQYFVTKFKVNEHQVFAVGMSGGGHMAYKLAMTMPDRIKAITAIVANLPDTSNMDCVALQKPIPVMIIDGTSDPINPYNGGEVVIPNVKLGKVRSTEQTFQYWATLAGYTGNPSKENLPDTDPNDGKTIEKYSYKEKGKPELVLLKVINGKHDFPNDIDVYLEAWQFFKRQMGTVKEK